ncbi:hypothetical protein P8452_33604 [Trifolium repens]|nr:hypothetical protein P8452_33604 [Trifolium repens]
MDNKIVDGVNEIESESTAETETGIESKNCSSSRESEDENELEEDDSEDITSWVIHDDESRRRSDRSRNDLELIKTCAWWNNGLLSSVFELVLVNYHQIQEYHRKHPVARVADANDDFEALLKEELQIDIGYKKEILLEKHLVKREDVFWRIGLKRNIKSQSNEAVDHEYKYNPKHISTLQPKSQAETDKSSAEFVSLCRSSTPDQVRRFHFTMWHIAELEIKEMT